MKNESKRPTPWRFILIFEYTQVGEIQDANNNFTGIQGSKDLLERIVACVNFCAGLSNAEIAELENAKAEFFHNAESIRQLAAEIKGAKPPCAGSSLMNL